MATFRLIMIARWILRGLFASICASASTCLGQTAILHLDETLIRWPGVTDDLRSSVQDMLIESADRAVAIDGSLRRPFPLGLAVAACAINAVHAPVLAADVVQVDGRLSLLETDIVLPCRGGAWRIGRSFSSRGNASLRSDGLQGINWVQTSQPELIPVYESESLTRLVLAWGADLHIMFALVDGTDVFRGVNGAAGVVVRSHPTESTPETFTYFDGTGMSCEFIGFESTIAQPIPSELKGQFRTLLVGGLVVAHTGEANTFASAVATGFDESGRLLLVVDSAGRAYRYVYSTGRLKEVIVRLGLDVEDPEVARVEYTYHDDSDDGSDGDLRTATTTLPTPDGDPIILTTYYRYWTLDDVPNGKRAHRPRLVLAPEGYRRATEAIGGTWESASDTTLATYASHAAIMYDSDGRVTSVKQNGLAEATSFVYEANEDHPDTPETYDNDWMTRTIVRQPGSGWITIYMDETGQVLALVRTSEDPSTATGAEVIAGSWCYVFERTETGLVSASYTPASVESYVPYDSSDNPNPDPFTLREAAGLVVRYDRVGSPSPLEGFPTAIKHASGSTGEAYFDIEYEYPSTLPSRTWGSSPNDYTLFRGVLETVRVYEVESTIPISGNAEDVHETAFAYEFAAGGGDDPLRLCKRTATLPLITHERNGAEGMQSVVEIYDMGRALLARKTAGGRVDTFLREAGTGLIRYRIQDADTEDPIVVEYGVEGVESTGAETHRVTEYLYDDQGRLRTILEPHGRMRMNMFAALGDGRAVAIAIPKVEIPGGESPNVYYGPVDVSIIGLDGRVHATAVMGPVLAPGVLVGASETSPIDWLNLAGESDVEIVKPGTDDPIVRGRLFVRKFDASGARLEELREYHRAWPSSGEGSALTHYRPTMIAHDESGRIIRTKNAPGSITRFTYDDIGRISTRWKGTSDGIFPPEETNDPQEFALSNMMKVEQWFYDNDLPGGNSHVTHEAKFTSRHASFSWEGIADTDLAGVRLTTRLIDERGRIVAVKQAAQPHFVFRYDTLGRMRGMGLFDAWDDGWTPSSVPDPTDASVTGRLSSRKWDYDQQGRLFRETKQAVHQFGGSLYSLDSSFNRQVDYAFDAEGRLAGVSGAIVTKYAYDRLGNLIDTLSVIPTIRYSPGTEDFAVWLADPASEIDIVMRSDDVFYDTDRGYAIAISSWERGASGFDLPSGPSPQSYTYGYDLSGEELMWSLRDWTGEPGSYNPLSDDGSRISLTLLWPDPLDRPTSSRNLGHPSYWRNNDGEPFDPNTGIPYSPATVPPFGLAYPTGGSFPVAGIVSSNSFTRYGPLGDVRSVSKPDGTTNDFEYNQDGSLSFESEQPYAPGDSSTPAGTPSGSPCSSIEHLFWDDGIYRQTIITEPAPGGGGREHVTPIAIVPGHIPPGLDITIGPGGIELDDPHRDPLPPPDLIWADDPIGIYDPSTGQVTLIGRNGQGEIISISDPAGIQIRHELDPLGRPKDRVTFLPSTPPTFPGPGIDLPSVADGFLRDGLGRISGGWVGDDLTPSVGFGMGYASGGGVGRHSQPLPTPAFGASGPHGSMPTPGVSYGYNAGCSCSRCDQIGGIASAAGHETTFSFGPSNPGVGFNLDHEAGRVSELSLVLPSINPVTGEPYTGAANLWAKYAYHGIYRPAETETFGPAAIEKRDYRHECAGTCDLPEDSGLDQFDRPSRLPIDTCAGAGPCEGFDPRWYHDPSGRLLEYTSPLADPSVTPSIYFPSGGDSAPVCLPYTDQGTDDGEFLYGRSEGSSFACIPPSDPAFPPVPSERWRIDGTGNVVYYRADKEWRPPCNSPVFPDLDEASADDYQIVFTYDTSNRLASSTKTFGSGSPPAAVEVTYRHDIYGNLWYTGGPWLYQYDQFGHLVKVYRHQRDEYGQPVFDNEDYPVVGDIFARFVYDNLGRRVAACYDLHDALGQTAFDPLHPQPHFAWWEGGDGDLDNDPIEYYVYDASWRLSTVYRQGPEGSEGAGEGVRPPPRAYERYAYHAMGLNGTGNASPLDAPLMMDRDEDGDGVFERRREYVQDSRHSIIAVRESSSGLAGAGERDFERIAYTAWGRPVDVSKPYDADFNNDGNVDQDDITDLELAIAGDPDPGWDTYLDINGDGAVNGDDLAELALGIGGGWPERNIYENRFLWRGYWYDPFLNLYHVRHRVYDPALMRWLQPDPAGYVDGYSLYAYCGGRPHDAYDPYGLVRDEWGLPTEMGPSTRAGEGPLNRQSEKLRRQTWIAGNAYLDTIAAAVDPNTYIDHVARLVTDPIGTAYGLADGVAVGAVKAWYFNDLPENQQAAFWGSAGAVVQIAATGWVVGRIDAAAGRAVDVGYGSWRGTHRFTSGSYTIEFASGMKYHGKGWWTRADENARALSRKYNDRVVAVDWTPAINEREGFKQEYRRLLDDGGPRSPTNYNKIESPGMKYCEVDGTP